jgi:hypothetical protein
MHDRCTALSLSFLTVTQYKGCIVQLPCCSDMTSFWTDACFHAGNQTLQKQIYNAHASCGVTVSHNAVVVCIFTVCSSSLILFSLQIAAFCVSACASGTMFYRWWKMEANSRQRVWWLYGWFSGLMLCGSCFGAVAWAAWMQRIVFNFNANHADDVSIEQAYLIARSLPWLSTFSVTYALEFLCLSVSKLMVLDRMSDFLRLQADFKPLRLLVSGRSLMVVVVAANAVGLAGNIAAAVRWLLARKYFSAASVALAANSSAIGKSSFDQGIALNRSAYFIASVQSFCEVAVLLLTIVAFAVVGVACHRRIGSMLLGVQAAEAAVSGRKLQLQIVGTVAFVFISFLLRSVYSTMYAVANALQNSESPCAAKGLGLCDPVCYNVYTRISWWIARTPEFQLTIELVSSPLAQLVALWGMTSQLTLQLMRKNYHEASMSSASASLVAPSPARCSSPSDSLFRVK